MRRKRRGSSRKQVGAPFYCPATWLKSTFAKRSSTARWRASAINTASIQAYNPSSTILDYATTKGAIVTFTKGLAEEMIDGGVRVNCVAPGPVWTPLIAQSFEGKKLTEFGKTSPMKRPAQPAELAPAFVFLACDDASYVNGEILGVTGGKPLG